MNEWKNEKNKYHLQIIAPAAHANATGKQKRAHWTKYAPMKPEKTSTSPLIWPHQNAVINVHPSRRSGNATAKPSGKFWRPWNGERWRAVPS